LDLLARQFKVYTQPTPGATEEAVYLTARTFSEGQAVPVELDGQPVGSIPLSDFLPPPT
jgi:hypothetical protein